MPGGTTLTRALAAAAAGFNHLAPNQRIRTGQGFCATPRSCCGTASRKIARTIMTLEQGQAAGGVHSRDIGSSRHDRLVRRGGPAGLRSSCPCALSSMSARSSSRSLIGPVAAFSPWNFPLNQAVRKVAAGLAAGLLGYPEGTGRNPGELRRTCPRIRRMPACLPACSTWSTACPADISDHLIAASDHSQDLVYWLHVLSANSWPLLPVHAYEAGDDGTWRPRAGDRIRRRRRRSGRPNPGRSEIPQCGPGLRCSNPLPHSGESLCQVSSMASSRRQRRSRWATDWMRA